MSIIPSPYIRLAGRTAAPLSIIWRTYANIRARNCAQSECRDLRNPDAAGLAFRWGAGFASH